MLTTIGVWLLVAGAIAIVVEGIVAALWFVSLVRRSRALSEQIEAGRGLIEADLALLQAAVVETKRLWTPYRRLLRVLRHPLAVALLQSYVRRRASVR